MFLAASPANGSSIEFEQNEEGFFREIDIQHLHLSDLDSVQKIR